MVTCVSRVPAAVAVKLFQVDSYRDALDPLAAARPGLAGKTAEQAELDEAKAEIERPRATVTEQAVALHLRQGKSPWTDHRGPVPPRVQADVKAGLLALVAYAQSEGRWSLRKAAAALGLEHVRVLRWLGRAAVGRLADARSGEAIRAARRTGAAHSPRSTGSTRRQLRQDHP